MTLKALPPYDPDLGLARAGLPADATPAPVWGVTFLTQAADGVGRYPSGWDTEGLCWTPYRCGAVTVMDVKTGDTTGGGDCVAACDICEALPFEINFSELHDRCAPGDRAQYARDQVALATPIVVAQKAFEVLQANAVDVTGENGPVACCIGAGAIRANRSGPTALHIPETHIDCASACGLVSYTNGRQVDALGARSYGVPGYPNIGPDGTTPTDGSFWLYGSSPYIDRGVTDIESSEDENKDTKRQNARAPWARRRGLVRVDCTEVFAVNVTVCGCCE